MDVKTPNLDLIPESMRDPIIQEVAELLKEKKQKSDKEISPEMQQYIANKKKTRSTK